MDDTGPLAHRPNVDVAALDVAGLTAAEGQVDELAQAEEEVGADRKTAALEFKAVIEKLLRVIELRQAQNIAAAEHFVGQLQGGNVRFGIQILADAVDQRETDGAAGNA